VCSSDLAIPAHQEAYSAELEAGLEQLRAELRQAVSIAQTLHSAAASQGEDLFPGLWMPEADADAGGD
jgi:hypothetical protein